MRAVLALLVFTNPAWARCPDASDTFLSCQIDDTARRLEVCIASDTLTYSFGPPGAPELTMTETAARIDYRPWPGVGRTIYEEVTFENAGYRYVVFGGIERDYDDTDEEIIPTQFGGVTVHEGASETPIAGFTCAEGATEFPWTMGLSDAKAAAGLAWDHYEHTWLPIPE